MSIIYIMIQCSISPSLTGGIGNQLFQIAAAYSYSINNKCELIINEPKVIGWAHKKNTSNNKYKDLPQEICKIFPNLVCTENIKYEWDTYAKQKRGLWYDNIPLNIYIRKNEKTKLIGVFSSYMYFKGHDEKIIKLFEFSPKIEQIAYKNFKEIIDNPYTISLHFRRGDRYRKVKRKLQHWCIVKLDYYYRAINKFIETKKGYTFVLFNEEEDDTWIKDYIIPYLNKMNQKYIHIHYDVPSTLSLYLITKCKNNIISNSTFSFWGAFLNQNKSKLVYVPQVWKSFDNPYKLAVSLRGNIMSTKTDERLPKDWIKIDVECIE